MVDSHVGAVKTDMLGRRLREYRDLRRLTLRAVAERADVSAGFLSQLERGLSSASIASLARIASALEIGVADLFADGKIGVSPLHAADRPVIRASDGVRKTLLTRAPLRGMDFYAVEFESGGSTGPEQYSHPGQHEVVAVLQGAVTIELGDRSLVLHAGDSLDFESRSPHRIHNHTTDTAFLHWVIGPAQRSARSKA
ncbi:cupin domain-containing protein [Aeromicrobium sp.]|uniref:helix-turn-helix domain-containing protein n=1 Tax=Aeromicrobium sp. TaxID=1871063 RepID=UPI00198CA24C|nr:cupin domain-containing protein [Aeromicrobium sp.]MBC7630799.1 cupin domain-containing protein [Aeromicrobium sp.]